MKSAVLTGTASRRRVLRTSGLAALTAAGLFAALIGGFAPPADAADLDLGPVVTRVSGADRYDMAAKISQRMNPRGALVVFIASGASFPDALSAGPAAVQNSGPLLLVEPNAVPPTVKTELTRLFPLRIVVVGGPMTISDAVLDQLRAVAPQASVERITGADRYAVGRAVVANTFTSNPERAYLATGANFPDALTAGAVAGGRGSPVVLVDGGAAAVDDPTLFLLGSLMSHDVFLVGGTTSISGGIERSFPFDTTVHRVAGADRYAVSMNLNATTPSNFDTVYLATGANYPDALAGGVLAGFEHHPMFIVPSDCVPRGVLTQMSSRGTRNVVLLGGTASLGPAVEALTSCTW